MAIKGNPNRIFCKGVRWGDLGEASYSQIVGYFKIRVEMSFFGPLEELLLPNYKTTGFITLATISALIDALAQYYYHQEKLKHKDKYKQFLRDHFPEFRQEIFVKQFPHAKDLADFFYEGFRCQILHNFMLSEYSTIGWKTGLVHINVWDEKKGSKEIIINPRILVDRLKKIFYGYIEELLTQEDTPLKERFIKQLFIDTGVKIKG